MLRRSTLTICSVFCTSLIAGAALANCPADLDGDGVVGSGDLAQLLAAWGPGTGPADLDGDGVVGPADLAMMLGAWGDCPDPGVEIFDVFPPQGEPGAEIQLIGQFPSNDPYDYCVVIAEPGGGPQQFAPVQVIDILDDGAGNQIMRAQLGPVHFDGPGLLQVHLGEGQPVGIDNPFNEVQLIAEGACVGNMQPAGANIIFNVSGGGDGACGPLYDHSYVGSISGDSLCVTIPPLPGVYPPGTTVSVWPRFHNCDGWYVRDLGTIEFVLVEDISPMILAQIIQQLLANEVASCPGAGGVVPTITVTANADGSITICMTTPGHAVCAGNLVICIDLP